MLAVRYVTLAALVVWLGGMTTLAWVVPPATTGTRLFQVVACVCGTVILLGLLVLKFVGPPPRAFIPRLALAAAGLVSAMYAATWAETSSIPRGIQMAVGFVLLFWYVRE